MKFLLTLSLLWGFMEVKSQAQQVPFIRLTNPFKSSNEVSSSRQFITGATCTNCLLTINGKQVKVYPTGAFAHELNLVPGDTVITIIAEGHGKSTSKKYNYSYTLPKPAEPVKTLAIESIRIFPEGDLVLAPGDVVKFRVKALPGSTVKVLKNFSLTEIPADRMNGMPGIYQGEYVIKETDTLSGQKLPVVVSDSLGNVALRETSSRFFTVSPQAPD